MRDWGFSTRPPTRLRQRKIPELRCRSPLATPPSPAPGFARPLLCTRTPPPGAWLSPTPITSSSNRGYLIRQLVYLQGPTGVDKLDQLGHFTVRTRVRLQRVQRTYRLLYVRPKTFPTVRLAATGSSRSAQRRAPPTRLADRQFPEHRGSASASCAPDPAASPFSASFPATHTHSSRLGSEPPAWSPTASAILPFLESEVLRPGRSCPNSSGSLPSSPLPPQRLAR